MSTSLIGQVLGKYRIVEKVGSEALADVYRATQDGLDRDVAVKVLTPSFSSDPEMVRRFRRESQATAQLRHPNIVTVFDSGEQDGIHFQVTELVRPDSLEDLLEVEHDVALPRALDILKDVLQALDHIHSRNVIHRSLSPAAIRFDDQDHALVTDFAAPERDRPTMVGPGVLLGDPGYLSPEHLAGMTADVKSDLFQAAALLYRMVTGRPIREVRASAGLSMLEILALPIPDAHEVTPSVPPDVAAFLDKALSKLAEGRFASAREMLTALRKLQLRVQSRDPNLAAATSAVARRSGSKPSARSSAPADSRSPRSGPDQGAVASRAPLKSVPSPAPALGDGETEVLPGRGRDLGRSGPEFPKSQLKSDHDSKDRGGGQRRPQVSTGSQGRAPAFDSTEDAPQTSPTVALAVMGLLVTGALATGALVARSWTTTAPESQVMVLEQAAVVGQRKATVRWRTAGPVMPALICWPMASPDRTVTLSAGGQARKDFEVIVPDLEPGTYRYRIDVPGRIWAGGMAATSFDGAFTIEKDLEISALEIVESSRSALVTWTTSRATDTRVSYGTSAMMDRTAKVEHEGGLHDHTVEIKGLEPGTLYHLQVVSTPTEGGARVHGVGTTFRTASSGIERGGGSAAPPPFLNRK